MAYKDVKSLDCDEIIAIGGTNKAGKENPNSLEGFYLGKNKRDDKKKKSGFSYVYVFQTAKGNIGVWSKTDLDRKMSGAVRGLMTLVTHTGFRDTPNGEMYTYRVQQDPDNSTDVNDIVETAESEVDGDADGGDDTTYSSAPARSAYRPPSATVAAPLAVPSADEQAKVRAALDRARGRS